MSTLSTLLKLTATTTETLTNDDLNANSTLLHSGYDVNRTLDANTTPNATKAAFETVAMTSGAATIDLTALTLNGVAVTFSAIKPRIVIVTALAANSGNVTVAKGASNGYDGMGSAFSVTLEPGQSFAFDFNATGNAVGSGNKTLDISGTGTDGVRLSAVAGT